MRKDSPIPIPSIDKDITRRGWIDVNDELPELEEEVILNYSNSTYNGCCFAAYGKMINNKEFVLRSQYEEKKYSMSVKSDGFDIAFVTHWAYIKPDNNLKIIQYYDRFK